MTLKQAFNDFIESRVLGGLSLKTIEDYESFVTPFVSFVGSDLPVESLTLDMVNKYIILLRKRSIRPATLATYVRHIKVFLRWINDDFSLSFSLRKIRVPKTPKKVVHIYTDEEVKQIFDSVKAESDWITARNRAMIALMYDSGLRQNEVCTLQLHNVDFSTNRMIVRGKGDKERIVPLGDVSAEYLRLYLSICPFDILGNIFVSRRGGEFTCNALKLLVSRISERVPFPIHCHLLRHNFATNYLVDQYHKHKHMDAQFLQIIMGHEDYQTTQRYLHFAMQIVASESRNSHLDQILL